MLEIQPQLQIALLFIGAFAAAAISGSAGFGGALLLLPLLTAVVGPKEAVPLLTVAQLFGNFSRAGFGFKQIQWKPVAWFLFGAIPLSLVGAISFVRLPASVITRGIGVAVLVFAVLKYFHILDFRPSKRLLVIGGGVTGLLSGLVGSAGPVGAAVFLSLGLPPVAYVASEASTALAMHAVKTIVYGSMLKLDNEFWMLGALLGVAMIAGTWAANRVISHVSQEGFERYVLVLLSVLAGYLIFHG